MYGMNATDYYYRLYGVKQTTKWTPIYVGDAKRVSVSGEAYLDTTADNLYTTKELTGEWSLPLATIPVGPKLSTIKLTENTVDGLTYITAYTGSECDLIGFTGDDTTLTPTTDVLTHQFATNDIELNLKSKYWIQASVKILDLSDLFASIANLYIDCYRYGTFDRSVELPYTNQDGVLTSSRIELPASMDAVKFRANFAPTVDIDIISTSITKPAEWLGFTIWNGRDVIKYTSSDVRYNIVNSGSSPQISSAMTSLSTGLQEGDIAIWAVNTFSYKAPTAEELTTSSDADMGLIRYAIYSAGAFGAAMSLTKNESDEYQISYDPWIITVTLERTASYVAAQAEYFVSSTKLKLDYNLDNTYTGTTYLQLRSLLNNFDFISATMRAPITAINTDIETTTTFTGTEMNRVYTHVTDEDVQIIRAKYLKTSDTWELSTLQKELVPKLNPESWMKITDIMVSLIKDRFVQRGTLKIPPAASASDYTLTYQYPFETVPTLEFANNNAYDATVTTTGATIRLSAHTETMFLDWIAWTE
jgi:hypothetical protein